MIDLSTLDLQWWEKEDIEDLLEEYPQLLEMSLDEIKKLKTELYWESQHLIDRANAIESKADSLQTLINELE